MKIALVYDLLYPFSIGGAESRTFSLATELVLRGHEVHLYGVKMWRGSNTKQVTQGFFMHGVSKYSGVYGFKGKRKITEPIKYSLALLPELLKERFDVIDVSSFPYFPIFPSYAASFFKRSKLVITWHEVWDEYWETQGFARFPGWTIERMCARLSSRNIAVSDMTASRLARIGGKGIHIIPNWVDLETIDKAKPAKRRYDIISTGRHLKSKNFDRLLTVSALLKKTKKDFSALILGEGPGTYELLRLRRKLGLEDCVDILSFCPEKEGLYSYMKASSVFVLLSGLEGFSLSAMEAMACSLPILTTNGERNALKELVKGNGFVCRESEVEIASRLSQLLSDSKMREKMGKASRKIAEAHNPDGAMRKILKVYSS